MAQFGSAPYQELTYDLFGNPTRIARGTQKGGILTYVDYSMDPTTNHLQGAYALANPLRYIDPSGLDVVPGPCPEGQAPPCYMDMITVRLVEIVTIEVTPDFLAGPRGHDELGLLDRILSSVPIQSNKYGECVREHRADPAKALVALGTAVPKKLVPPF